MWFLKCFRNLKITFFWLFLSLEICFLRAQSTDLTRNEAMTQADSQKIFFHQERSLERIDTEIRILNSPCPYLPIAIEKALVARDLTLGRKWGKEYSTCKEPKPKALLNYAIILHLSGETSEKKKVLEIGWD